MRTFIAVNFDEVIRTNLKKAQQELMKYTISGKYSSYDNMHITVVFIGEVSENDIDSIVKIMQGIKTSPFRLLYRLRSQN